MVTLLTSYTKQRYVLNSADDRGDIVFRNGDTIFLMDVQQELIYSEENNQWYQVPSAGGGDGGYEANDWLDHTKPTGLISSDAASIPSLLTMAGRTGSFSIALPNATEIPDSFCNGCTGLTAVDMPLITKVPTNGFKGCTSLGSSKFQSVTQIMGYAFDGCNCEALVFPALRSFGAKHALDTWNGKYFDCLGLTNTEYTFSSYNINLRVLIIRSTTAQPKPYGLPNGIVVYVPSSLKSTYETATNWSAWLAGSQYNSFAAIEGSEYETHYADGTPIS